MTFIIKSEQGYPVQSATLAATGNNASASPVALAATTSATASVPINASASVQAAPATSVATAIASGPIQVTGLTVGLLQVPLSWTAVSGATSYRLYRDGSLIANPSSTSATDTLAAGTSALYTVSAVNSSGAEGPQSTGVTVGASGLRRRIN